MGKYRKFSDEKLVELLYSDDGKAFEEIYTRYWSKLYVHLLRRVDDEEAAREIIQDVFVELWVCRHSRKIHTSLNGYLYKAIQYRALNHMKKQWVIERHSATVRTGADEGRNTTEETFQFEELYHRVNELCAELPPQCRRVFELSRKDYKTNREIAAELNISEKTVEFHLTKALRYLRAHLSDSISLFLISLFS